MTRLGMKKFVFDANVVKQKPVKTEQWNKYESTWQMSAVCGAIASIFTVHFSCLFIYLFIFFDVCSLKPRRKCHYTHPCEFVISVFETGRQEKAISNSKTFSTTNMSSLNVSGSCKNLRHCIEMACCIWYTEADSKSPLGYTSVSCSLFLQRPALWHKYIHPDKY